MVVRDCVLAFEAGFEDHGLQRGRGRFVATEPRGFELADRADVLQDRYGRFVQQFLAVRTFLMRHHYEGNRSIPDC